MAGLIPEWFISLSREVGAVAAFVVATGLLVAKTRVRAVARWFWRRAWGRDDHGTYLTPRIRAREFVRSAIQPQIDTLTERNDEQHRQAEAQRAAQHADNVQQFTEVKDRLSGVENRLTSVEEVLTTPNRRST